MYVCDDNAGRFPCQQGARRSEYARLIPNKTIAASREDVEEFSTLGRCPKFKRKAGRTRPDARDFGDVLGHASPAFRPERSIRLDD